MRTLQSQEGWCLKVQRGLIVAAVICIAGFYLVGYRPTAGRLESLERQAELKQRELDAGQARAKNLPIVEAEVQSLRRRLERFGKQLPREPDLGEFVREITHLSERASLKKLVFEPGNPRRSELFTILPITMNFEGDFLSVYSFLRQAEEMQRLTRIQRLTIRNPRGRGAADGIVEVQLDMNIYFSEP